MKDPKLTRKIRLAKIESFSSRFLKDLFLSFSARDKNSSSP